MAFYRYGKRENAAPPSASIVVRIRGYKRAFSLSQTIKHHVNISQSHCRDERRCDPVVNVKITTHIHPEFATKSVTFKHKPGLLYNMLILMVLHQVYIIVVSYPAYLASMQSTLCKMPGFMNHKLESRLLWEILTTTDIWMTPLYWQKRRGTKEPLDEGERGDMKDGL